jgi:magnesium chelatase family protein
VAIAVVRSRALLGIEAVEVVVEVHIANGLPGFSLVGLADTEVRESRERVRSALRACGYDFPARRITVKLAPADLQKSGGRFDLLIAIGILAASGQLLVEALTGLELAGELALNGELRPVRGGLAMALAARGRPRPRFTRCQRCRGEPGARRRGACDSPSHGSRATRARRRVARPSRNDRRRAPGRQPAHA